MQIPHIMSAGFDDLIPVVIILAVIVTRIMKAVREGKPLVPPTPGDRPRPTPQAPASQPAQELREFLQALSGAPQARPEPPPPPVQAQRPAIQARPQPPPPPPQAVRFTAQPRPKPQHQPRQKRFAKRGAPVQAAQPVPPPQPAPPRRRRHWEQEPPKPRPIIVEECELSPLRIALNEHLADKQSLRGAWLLREVLGPPVGLR